MKKVEDLTYQDLKSEASKRGIYKMGTTVANIKKAVQKHRDANPNFDLNAVQSPKEKKAAKGVAKAKKLPVKKEVVKKAAKKAAPKKSLPKGNTIVVEKKNGQVVKTTITPNAKPLNMTLLPAEDKLVKSDLSESIKIFILVSVFNRTTDFTDKYFETNRSKGLIYLLDGDKNRKENMVKKYNDFKAKK